MRALGSALLLVAAASCFASGCESVLGVRDLDPIEDAASSDVSVDSQSLEDASSDTPADTSKDSADEGLDAGADVSVGPADADADADANADAAAYSDANADAAAYSDADADASTDANAGDATDALVSDAGDGSETRLPETIWWKLPSEAGGYQSLSAVIVPGELPPGNFVTFNFSFSFERDIPPPPSLGSSWHAPYVALRWGPAQQKTATLHVPKTLTDAIEVVDAPDVVGPCPSSPPWILPCVGEFEAYNGFRFAEVALEWIPYRRYRYTITRVEQSRLPDVSTGSWWEASITDLQKNEVVPIGRFRLKADSSGLQPISRSQVIAFSNCDSTWPFIGAHAPRGERAGQARSALPFFQEASCVPDAGDAADR